MKEVIFALIACGLGAALIFAGYRLARIIIPLWGLFAGFALGASAASDAFSNAFIGTVSGIIVGAIVGLVFAVFAYFFFELAIVLLGANVGYMVGTSFISFLGLDKGFISALVGIVLGIIFGLVALFVNAPKYYLIFMTSLGGAVAVICGGLLLFGKIELGSFSYASTSAAISNSLIWGLIAFALLIVGIVFQIYQTSSYKLEEWRAI